jgi:hypothetical protein
VFIDITTAPTRTYGPTGAPASEFLAQNFCPVFIDITTAPTRTYGPTGATASEFLAQNFCPVDRSRALPPAVVDFALLPAAAAARPLLATTPQPVSQPVAPLPPIIATFDVHEAGKVLAPTASPITSATAKANGLDPRTPRFRTAREKDDFEATLPSAVQAHLNQPFGKDNLDQCFYLQKTGDMTLLLLYKSGFLSNNDKKKFERVCKPARKLAQLWKRYRNVDFSGLRGFQLGWETQKELSKVREDMTTACLFYFNLSLPTVVRLIGGPHAAEHRDHDAIFARIKPTCSEGNYNELVRIFTKGSPTYINADMTQDDCKEFRAFGNHASCAENPKTLTKTLVKEVSRGFALTLNPEVMDFLENVRQTPQGILYIDHPRKNPRVVCDSSLRPKAWSYAINDVTNKRNGPWLMFAGSFKATLTWIWNLCITYPDMEIYLCDDDVSAAFRQVKYPPNLAGLHCYVVNGVLFVATGQTFGDTTSPPNFEPIASAGGSTRELCGFCPIPSSGPYRCYQRFGTRIPQRPVKSRLLSRQIGTRRTQVSLMRKGTASHLVPTPCR